MTTTDPGLCGEPTYDGRTCALPRHSRGYHDADPPVLTVPKRKGRHTVSISQLRRYGATDLMGEGAETVRGCPRAYALVYGRAPIPEAPNRAAELGSVLHRALHHMEVNACGPEEALGEVWTPALSFTDFKEAIKILNGYLSRGGPLTRYANLAVELDVTATLFTDPVHGPIDYRGVLDNVSIDPLEPEVVRLIDYKSSARPVATDTLRGDVQLLGYVWLLAEWWKTQYGQYPERVVAHLDLLRYRDIAIEYTRAELTLWHEWACAQVRVMLRDNAPAPILNDGCTNCPVRWSCPAWNALPGEGESMLARLTGLPADQLAARYGTAAKISKLLGKQVEDTRRALEAETIATGHLEVAGETWTPKAGSKTVVDVIRVADLLLPAHPGAFETAVTASEASVERAVEGLDDMTLQGRLLSTVRKVEAGTKVSKSKVKA